MEKGLKTLQNVGRPRRSGLRQESPTSHQSGDPTEDQFFMDPDHSHAALSAMGPGIPHASYPQQPFPTGYGPRSRGGSVAPPSMMPASTMATGGHRYSSSNSSNYSSAGGPVSSAAYANMGFSPTTAYNAGLNAGLPAPPLPSFSRTFEPGAPAAGPSLPSLHSFLQSPREPISAASY